MDGIPNPVSGNSFVDLVSFRNKAVFADKTDFIAKISANINRNRRLFAVTRPRGFGKTVTAHMLLAYYSKAYAGQHIFDGLKITDEDNRDSYLKHLNRYDVIYLDMNSLRVKYSEYAKDEALQVKGVTAFADYLKYAIIEDLKENADYAGVIGKSKKVGKKSLIAALRAVCEYTKERFILIMDEWDLVFRDYRNAPGLQDDFMNLLRSLFESDGGRGCFALAYLTGRLPIRKNSSQFALNTFFDENTAMAPAPFASYFGFTETEIAETVKLPSCKLTQEELKVWYGGYRLNGMDIYNPASVVSAVRDGECKGYWCGPSSNEKASGEASDKEVARLLNMNFPGIREDMLNLLAGGETVFSCGRFQNDMTGIKSRDDALCLLVCLGYLGCKNPDGETSAAEKSSDENRDDKTEETEPEQLRRLDYLGAARRRNRRIAYVPNAEIKAALLDIVKEQYWNESQGAHKTIPAPSESQQGS